MALTPEDKADVSGAMGKALANKVSKVTRDGVDKDKRWGNSGIKGVGANSPAMMEARKGFAKSKALQGKTKDSFISRLEAHKAEARSFDDGTRKPKNGESFIQALERHKSQREFD